MKTNTVETSLNAMRKIFARYMGCPSSCQWQRPSISVAECDKFLLQSGIQRTLISSYQLSSSSLAEPFLQTFKIRLATWVDAGGGTCDKLGRATLSFPLSQKFLLFPKMSQYPNQKKKSPNQKKHLNKPSNFHSQLFPTNSYPKNFPHKKQQKNIFHHFEILPQFICFIHPQITFNNLQKKFEFQRIKKNFNVRRPRFLAVPPQRLLADFYLRDKSFFGKRISKIPKVFLGKRISQIPKSFFGGKKILKVFFWGKITCGKKFFFLQEWFK